jgi:hypothetical protein
MAGTVRTWWRGWRERQRQYKIERALYKQREGGTMGGTGKIDAGKDGLPMGPAGPNGPGAG